MFAGSPRDLPAAYRRVLWTVILINAAMFALEMVAGLRAGSLALQADALDFLGDSATYAVNGAEISGFTLQADGTWSFDPADSEYQRIAQDATEDVVVNYTVTDQHGASDSESFTITVTGTNDAPVATFDAAQTTTEDDNPITGQITFTELDGDDTVTFSHDDAAISGFTLDVNTGEWSFEAYVKAPNGETQDEFGQSVSLYKRFGLLVLQLFPSR